MKTDIAKEWLSSANLDLENISYIIRVEHLSAIVAFHSHQSIEKSLKALLASKNMKIPKIHSLEKLFKLCEKDFQNIDFDMVDLLDSLYINSRYPSEFGLLPCGKPTLEDAKEFYDFAIMVFDKVCDLLGIDKESLK